MSESFDLLEVLFTAAVLFLLASRIARFVLLSGTFWPFFSDTLFSMPDGSGIPTLYFPHFTVLALYALRPTHHRSLCPSFPPLFSIPTRSSIFEVSMLSSDSAELADGFR